MSLEIEMRVQDHTERLETTQRELKTLKTQLDGQMAANATLLVQKNDLKNVWKEINSTAEKIRNTSTTSADCATGLHGKLINITRTLK